MFSVHGAWEIQVSNNIVVQWFGGSWNEEAIVKYVDEFRDKTRHLNSCEWAIMSFFDEWELGVPGIEPLVAEHCSWFKRNGCVKDCHIYTPNIVASEQLERMIPHTDATYERRVFSSYVPAYSWLKTHDFILEDENILERMLSLKI